MSTNTRHFFDLTPQTLGEICREIGAPRFTAGQVMDWVYRKGATDFESMTNLSKAHRTALAERVHILEGTVIAQQTATDDTQKLLIQWGERLDISSGSPVVLDASRQTECVMIPTETRRTACVSSQIGCPVGCAFCASGLGGLDGNLTRGQIVQQVFQLSHGSYGPQPFGSRRASTPGRPTRVTNIVFMGMGEPLANFAAVADAIRTLNASWGFGIGARRITVSTVGLPRAIRRLVEFEIPVTLALSLHAPDDEIRRRLIPWAQYTTIDELLDACDEYFEKTGREITLEYILLGGVNDRPEHAGELARIAKRLRSNVNLIRYNEVKGLPFDRPHTACVHEFQRILRSRGVNARIRRSRGRDIAAACGQLRHDVHRAPQPGERGATVR